jgi:hypothetical protein
MTSYVAVANIALIHMGQSPIISLDDPYPATVMKARYESVRDAEIRRRRWRFSMARASLAADSVAPEASPYSLRYPLPSDFLALVQVGDFYWGPDLSNYRLGSDAPYQLEGRYILTNMGAPLKIRYARRVTDPGLFDAAFVESYGARLAFETCEKITQSSTKKDEMRAVYALAIKEAATANALENPSESIQDGSWVIGRRG